MRFWGRPEQKTTIVMPLRSLCRSEHSTGGFHVPHVVTYERTYWTHENKPVVCCVGLIGHPSVQRLLMDWGASVLK